jgi:amino-acid N-acetyltransferase
MAAEIQTQAEIRDAQPDDLALVTEFLRPFVERLQLLPRDPSEINTLLRHGFVAELHGVIVGFVAVEIYSRKLAEVQCLAVASEHQGKGIGKRLVQRCIDRARREQVLELMAITASEQVLMSCGFDYSLPGQKKALFIHTRDA